MSNGPVTHVGFPVVDITLMWEIYGKSMKIYGESGNPGHLWGIYEECVETCIE
jgi:hypothetical protein